MKVDYHECSSFIKQKLNVKLFPYQEAMLKAFCDGREVRTARGIGRTFVVNCFCKYIASILDKNNYEKESDVVLPYTCAVESWTCNTGRCIMTTKWIESIKKVLPDEVFRREFLCE